MIKIDEIKKHSNSNDVNDNELALLGDIDKDEEFKKYISTNENRVLVNLESNPRAFRNHKEIINNLILKYISWKIWKDSSLRDLKQEVKKLDQDVKGSKNDLDEIKKSAKYIGGAQILVEYSKSFSNRSKEHEKASSRQFYYFLFSLAFFASAIILTFFFSIADFSILKRIIADDINSVKYNLGFLGIKIFILIFAYQITQFFKKNYNAEKHLQEVYQHRSDVLQSLHAVYNSLTEDSKERNEILRAGALFAYDRGETGYITTREGAGSDDNLIQGIFGRLFNQ